MMKTIVKGNWKTPRIETWKDAVSSIFHDENKIILGYSPGDTYEFILMTIVHETNHWAHWYLLTEKEIDRYLKGKMKAELIHGVPYHKTVSEAVAWWGLPCSGEYDEVRLIRKDGEKI